MQPLSPGLIGLSNQSPKYGPDIYPSSPSFITPSGGWNAIGRVLTKTASGAGFQSVRVEDFITPNAPYRLDIEIAELQVSGGLFVSLTDGGGGNQVYFANGLPLGEGLHSLTATAPSNGADLSFGSNGWQATVTVRAIREILF